MRTVLLSEVLESSQSGYWGSDPGSSEIDALVVRNGDIAEAGTVRWDALPVRGLKAREVGNAEVQAGDLLMTTSGYCGQVAHVTRKPEALTCTSNFVRRLRVDPDRVVPRYLYHFMNRSEFRESLAPFIRGTTMKNLAVTQAAANVTIPLPPIDDQRRVAAILDQADELRAKRRASLAILDSLTESIFLDMFGDPVRNARGWATVRLDDVIERIDSGKSPVCLNRAARPDEWGVLKLGAVTWCEYDDREHKALPPEVGPDPQHEVRAGDVLFARKNTRELVGAAALVRATRPRLLLSDLIFRLRLGPQARVVPEFLHQVLIVPGVRREIQRLAGGSAGSMPNISKSRLLQFEIVLPSLVQQAEFADRVASVQGSRTNSSRSNTELDTLFSSLQHQAFRGEL